MKKIADMFCLLLFPVLAIILELLPYGAVLTFAPNPTDRIRETFSYFDLLPFGYANFAPFITAILTCFILILAIVVVVKKDVRHRKHLSVLSLVTTVISLLPLVFGIKNYSLTGAGITFCIAMEFVISSGLINLKRNKTKLSLHCADKQYEKM